MIPDSWRFGFVQPENGLLRFMRMDAGELVAWKAVERFIVAPMAPDEKREPTAWISPRELEALRANRAAFVTPGGADGDTPLYGRMTPARAERALRDLSSVARKVYDSVPVEDCWTDNQITSEMRRLGLTPNMTVIRGCLNTLLLARLVKEPKPRHFQRAVIREPHNFKFEIDMNPQRSPENTATTHRPGAAPAPTQAPEAEKVSALTRLARLSVTLQSIVGELEDIAIQVDEDLRGNGQEVEELRQLRDMMRKFVK